MKQAEESFWNYWKNKWPFATKNEKILEKSANFVETREAYLAGWEDSKKRILGWIPGR